MVINRLDLRNSEHSYHIVFLVALTSWLYRWNLQNDYYTFELGNGYSFMDEIHIFLFCYKFDVQVATDIVRDD